MSAQVQKVGDAASLATAVGALAGWLPPLAALFTIIWTGLQIYNWCEDRELLGLRRRERRRQQEPPA